MTDIAICQPTMSDRWWSFERVEEPTGREERWKTTQEW